MTYPIHTNKGNAHTPITRWTSDQRRADVHCDKLGGVVVVYLWLDVTLGLFTKIIKYEKSCGLSCLKHYSYWKVSQFSIGNPGRSHHEARHITSNHILRSLVKRKCILWFMWWNVNGLSHGRHKVINRCCLIYLLCLIRDTKILLSDRKDRIRYGLLLFFQNCNLCFVIRTSKSSTQWMFL